MSQSPKASNKLQCRECGRTLALDIGGKRFNVHTEDEVEPTEAAISLMCPKCKSINLIKYVENDQTEEYSYFEAGVVNGL